MTPKLKFIHLCILLLNTENGISGDAYSHLCDYAKQVGYQDVSDFLTSTVEATDDSFYLPEESNDFWIGEILAACGM